MAPAKKFMTIASCVLITLLPINSMALDLDLTLQEESALTRLTQEDKQIIKSVAQQSLEQGKDGGSKVWSNPSTGHAGVITVLSSTQSAQGLCRKLRLINTAGELTSTTFTTLCESNNKWVETTIRATTTETNAAYSSTAPKESEMQRKTLSQTSEHCQQLSQDIKNLKGKPQQRSTAISLYQSECQHLSN